VLIYQTRLTPHAADGSTRRNFGNLRTKLGIEWRASGRLGATDASRWTNR